MDAVSESRQGVLIAASENLATANFTLIAMKAKLTAAKNLRIKGQVEQAEPIRCSENSFSLQQNYAVLTHWSTKP